MMNTQKLLQLALEGVDTLGYQLDQLGLTSRVNRHNLAAFLFTEQKHLEGEWDSLQAKVDYRRAQLEHLAAALESRWDTLTGALLGRFKSTS
ncbi:hypothetical protein [Marinobacter lutaoensis]